MDATLQLSVATRIARLRLSATRATPHITIELVEPTVSVRGVALRGTPIGAAPPPKPLTAAEIRGSLALFFDALEIAGLTTLTLDRNLPAPQWTGDLSPPFLMGMLHAKYRYFLAHIRTDKTVYTVPELRRLLGIIPKDGYHAETDLGKEREALMRALGWPTETLTIDELRAAVEAL